MCVLYDMVFEEGKELGEKRGEERGEKNGKRKEAVSNAKMLFRNGASMELVAASIKTLSEKELEKIYKEEHKDY